MNQEKRESVSNRLDNNDAAMMTNDSDGDPLTAVATSTSGLRRRKGKIMSRAKETIENGKWIRKIFTCIPTLILLTEEMNEKYQIKFVLIINYPSLYLLFFYTNGRFPRVTHSCIIAKWFSPNENNFKIIDKTCQLEHSNHPHDQERVVQVPLVLSW